MRRSTEVYGPAYLDRIVRIDEPLLSQDYGAPFDQSVDGRGEFGVQSGSGLVLADPDGGMVKIELPDGWPGPWGTVRLNRPLAPGRSPFRRSVCGVAWQDDLGGMGAGYAKALGGRLVSAIGAAEDRVSRDVAALLARAGIDSHAIRVPRQSADWTLLVTSGSHGDKLPVGFRGCHAALTAWPQAVFGICDLRVAASLSNRLAAQALRASGAAVRLFAPSIRNMLDRAPAVSEFASAIDVLCCNAHEWEALEDREEVAWRVSLLAVTDGPNGSTVRFTTPEGEPGLVRVSAFPRVHPPRDTNRAGEAYAATLVATLLDHGWTPGVADGALVQLAAQRASAAAALELDLLDFGFPTPDEIDRTLLRGRID